MGLMPEPAVRELDDAYLFLRNLEHRLQYLDDAQTQRLPNSLEDRLKIAQSMGFSDWEGFEARLNQLRKKVAGHFEQVFGAPQVDQTSHPLAGLHALPDEAALERLDELGFSDSRKMLDLLRDFLGSSRYAGLPADNKAALDSLLPPLIDVSARQSRPDATLARILTLLESISRRAPYSAPAARVPANPGTGRQAGLRQPLGGAVPDPATAPARRDARRAHPDGAAGLGAETGRTARPHRVFPRRRRTADG
jgi:glutamate-ammonia-ligase adenylyltransferase